MSEEGKLKEMMAETELQHAGIMRMGLHRTEDIYEILDEAKKEFPKDTDKKYENMVFTGRRLALCYNQTAWFRKWFGSTEK